MKTKRIAALVAFSIGTACFLLTSTTSPEAETVSGEMTTTSSALAVANLDSQISSARSLLSADPKNFNFRRQLFSLLSTRTQFLGTYTDFREMQRLSTATTPTTVEELLLQSNYLSVVHDFTQALAVLDRAATLEPQNPEIRRQRFKVKTALRVDLPEILKEQQAVVAQFPVYGEFIILAGIQAELGDFVGADQSFQKAMDTYRDVSPFAVAFLYFQRGVMWAEKAGDSARGMELYRNALSHLPEYVVATVHHSELVHEAGETTAAIAALRRVVSAQDPEPKGLLGELLHNEGESAESAQLIAAGTTDYNALLRDFPLAFADHGSEFFSGPGADPSRGLALARQNLANRKNERAYIVAIEAAQAAAVSQTELCTLVAEAQALPPAYTTLQTLIQGIPCTE
jgi:tetratricopeptide (TPR) repeat protein